MPRKPLAQIDAAYRHYLFIRGRVVARVYERFLSIPDIFPLNSVGIVTADNPTISGRHKMSGTRSAVRKNQRTRTAPSIGQGRRMEGHTRQDILDSGLAAIKSFGLYRPSTCATYYTRASAAVHAAQEVMLLTGDNQRCAWKGKDRSSVQVITLASVPKRLRTSTSSSWECQFSPLPVSRPSNRRKTKPGSDVMSMMLFSRRAIWRTATESECGHC